MALLVRPGDAQETDQLPALRAVAEAGELLLKREGRHFIVNTHLLMTFLYPEEARARPR